MINFKEDIFIMKCYVCSHCGNIVNMISDSGVPVMCCGAKMEELVPNTVEASVEKHIPQVEIVGNEVKVTVGSVEHPMLPEHYIQWIYLETEKGGQRKNLNPGEAPSVAFTLNDDKAVAVYAYCNLHGLWKAEVKEKKVCDAKPVAANSKENYIVCNCKNVSYFDILDEVNKHSNIENLLDVFEDVKSTTNCSTGCGGCYDKVTAIISDVLTSGN